MFHDRSLLERCFRGVVLPVLEYCSAVWCPAADTHIKLRDRVVSGARFLTGVCLSVILPIVDLLQFCVCCIRSGVTRCFLLMMRYLDRMCQSGLHAVPWPHIGILMRHLAAEPCSTAGLLFLSQCPSAIWNDLGDPVFDGVGLVGFNSRANAFYLPKLLYPYYSVLLLFFSFLSVYRLILWGWGLRTDRVYITLSQPCTSDRVYITLSQPNNNNNTS